MMDRRCRGESGNIFFTLFGAVALVGVIGAATATLMRGPVGTMVTLNQKAKVDAQLQIASKLAMLEAAQGGNSGDCDNDGFVEPLPADTTCASKPLGDPTKSGCIPSGIGSAKQDPWGTNFGYCAWDLGASNNGTGTCPVAGMYQGNAGDASPNSRVVIAIISAGPDRTFQTTCADDPAYVTTTPGSDDIVQTYTYAEAVQATDGLWRLKSGTPNTATIGKSIEVSGTAKFQSGITGDTSFSNGAMNFGAATGFFLPNQTSSGACAPSNAGSMRTDSSVDPTNPVLQICDPGAPADPHNHAGWYDVGGALAGTGVAGVNGQVQFNNSGAFGADAGLAWDNAAKKLTSTALASTGAATVGSTLDVTGNTTVGGTLIVTGATTANSTLEAKGLVTADDNLSVVKDAGVGGILNVTGATTLGNTLAVTGVASFTDQALGKQGSAGSPGFAFTGATSTGLFYSSGGVGLSAAGALHANVTASGLSVTGNTATSGNETVGGNVVATGNMAAGTSYQIGAIGSGVGMYTDAAGGLQLQTAGISRIAVNAAGQIGVKLVGPPTTDVDLDGVLRLRPLGTTHGTACGAITGAITYSSGDEFLVCSSVTGNWENVGEAEEAAAAAADLWTQLPDKRLYYLLNYVGIGTNNPLAMLHVNNGGLLVTGAHTGSAVTYMSGANTSMFFDPATGSLRAGTVDSNQWTNTNIGDQSIALGVNTTASGLSSIALGNHVVASNNYSMALGLGSMVGNGTVSGLDSFGIFMGDQTGVNLAAANTMALFGGKFLLDPGVPSLHLSVPGSLSADIYGGLGAINYCDETGANCFTAADIASGTIHAPGNNREIMYNSGGILGADPGLIFSSTGFLTTTKGIIIGGSGADTNGTFVNGGNTGSTGNANTMVGVLAGGSNTTGANNTFLGYNAGSTNTTGWRNILIGSGAVAPAAGTSNYLNIGNAIYGDMSSGLMYISGTGALTLPVGDNSNKPAGTNGMIRYNTTNGKFEAFQAGAWQDILTGAATENAAGLDQQVQFNNNGLLGAVAGLAFNSASNVLTVANRIIAGGSGADANSVMVSGGNGTSTGAGNAFFGVSSGVLNSSGMDNVFLGYNAGSTNTTGSGNILIGPGALASAAGTSHYLNIGNSIYGDMNSGLIYISGTGALTLPVGDNSNKPAGTNGMIRYNTTNGKFEAFQAGAWQDILTSAATANAAGLPTQVQLNEGGLLYASSGFTFNSTSGVLTNRNRIVVGGSGKDLFSTFISIANNTSTGSSNTAVGVGAFNSNTTGGWNTAVGSGALNSNGSGNGNTAYGYNALVFNISGGNNTAIGYNALSSSPVTGSNNIALGPNVASATLKSGSHNILIGTNSSVDTPLASTSNYINIGTAFYGDMTGGVYYVSGHGALTLPAGDNSNYPASPVNGMIRYNSAHGKFEAYQAGSWQDILTGSATANAAGLPTQVQLNEGGLLYASSGLTFNSSTGALITTASGVIAGEFMNTRTGGPTFGVSGAVASTGTAVGVYGTESGASNTGYAGYFTNDGGGAVTNYGVAGVTNATGAAYGVFGSETGASNTGAAGYFGNAGGGAVANYGVVGTTNATGAGMGVYGSETGAANTGYGVQALNNSATGWGVYSSGTSPNYFRGRIGINAAAPSVSLVVNGKDAIQIPAGLTGDRPAGVAGMIRFNSTTNVFEGYNGTIWGNLAGSGASISAAGSDQQVQFNNNGVLGATSGLAFNSTSGVLTVTDRAIIGGSGADTNSVMVSGGNGTSTGADNAFFGVSSGVLNSSGANNTFLGYNAGSTTTTGANDILIGSGALATAAGTSNYLNIGNVIKGDIATGTLQIVGTGALTLPIGGSGNRPAPVNGMIRYNSVNGKFEGYQAGAWQDILTGAATANAGGADTQVQINDRGILYASSGFTYNSTTGKLQLGGLAQIATASPVLVDLGGTFSSTPGANPKLKLYDDGANYFGLGVSLGSFDFITAPGDSFNFYEQGAGKLLTILSNGNVGIGTATPYSALDVNTGAIRLGSGTQTCTVANDTGTIRYNSVTHKLQSCYLLSGWTDVGAGAIGAAAGADKQVQFNNNGNLGAVAGLAFNSTSNVLTVANRIIAGGSGADTNSVFVSGGNGTSTGADNAFFGVSSGVLNSSGANNVFLGYNAGSTNTTGANNILIGSGALAAAAGTNNWLNIGNIIKGDMSTGLLYISSTGALTLPIGDNSNKPAGTNGMIRYNTANGKFEAFQAGSWQDILTGAATANAAGLPTEVQLNEGGLLYASSGFTFNSASGQLTVTAGGAASAAGYFSNTRVGGATYGVFGSSASAGAGTGVYGSETGAGNTGYGVVAVNNSATGWGVYSSGTSPNYFAGKVGIGTATPYSALDVNTGAIRLGSGTQTCTVANDTGTIRYNSVTHKLQSCYLLSGWQDVGSGAIGAAAGADTQVQFNNNGNLGATSGLAFNSTSKVLTVGNRIIAGGSGADTNSVFVSGGNGTSTGADNAFFGVSSGVLNSSGANNVFLGYNAGSTNTTGANNILIGSGALAPAAGTNDWLNIGNVIKGDMSAGLLYISSTGALTLPIGDNSNKPAGTNGMIRYNTANGKFEAFQAGSWQDILTGAATANAAGLPTEVQLNEGGLLYASSGFTFNSASGQLTVTAGGAASTAGYFSNTQTSGFTFGVYGSVASDAGIAVSGRQTGVNNNSYAGYFINEGSGPLPNYGVSGTASSTGAGYGVVGREDGASNTGAGGYFENSGVGATANYGLFGLTISTGAGTGVYGWEDGANNIGYGVQAVNNSATGWGIYSSGTSPNYFRGRIGINAASPSVSLVVNGKDAIQIPAGLTGDRPAGVAGMIRFNSTTNVFEGYNGTIWGNLAGAGASISAAGLDKQVQFNNNGVLGATSGLAFNSTSGVLTVTDRAIIGGSGADTNSVFVSGGNGTSTGADNAFFGVSSGVLNSSGANNVFLGYNAGSTNTTGANNILIGSGALAAAAGTNNWLNIGNVIKGDMSSGLIYISSTGALTLPIGNNSNKPAGSNGMIRYNTANGKFEAFQAGAWQDILTGAATANAAGLPTQVQLNEGGLLYASSGFTFNSASGQLTVTAGGGASTAGYFGNTRVGGATYGVYGSAASLGAGAGVYGAETGANNTGYGVVAVNNSATGWGIYSSGTSPNFFAGSVGIGTGTPYSALDVNTGAIRLGSGTQTCTVANDTGTIRYNSVTHKLQSCYLLSGWTDVGAGAIGAAAGADKQVQFNNNGNLGAVAGLAFNSTSNVLTVANRIIAGGSGADTNSVFVSGGNSTSTGADNAFFGVSSGVLNSSGANNVFLGYNAGSTNTTGAGNILIGSGALAPAAGTNNWLNIGNIIKGDMSTGLLYISSTGALTLPIGDNSNKPAGSNGMIRYNTANGKFEAFQAGAWQDILTGAATANAAGLPTQVQLNEGGLLYASSGFTFNSASGQLTVTAGGGASTAGYFGNTRVGGATYGVYGSAASLGAGAGVYGAETGANNTGYGVVAVNNSATGWGIYSSGTSPNFFAGSVGIGTGTPYSALDVNTGAIRLGSGTQTCTVANDTGTIRYNSVTHKLQSCYLLSGWTDVGAGAIGAAAGADKQVQFNNNGNLGAVAGLAFNSTSNVLTVANRIIAGGSGADTNSVFVSGGNSTSTGADNAFFGVSSGVLNSSGANNVFLGYNAGSTNTTGANNILIGSGALAAAAGTNNWLNIGNIIKGDMSTGLLYISSTGALTLPIGDNSNKPAGTNGMIRYNTANGKFEAFQAGSWQDILTGAATANAAGLPTEVQLNEGGLLYASSGFTFNSASGQLTVTAGGAASAAGYFSNTRVGGATYGVFGSSASAGAGTGVYGSETGAGNTGYGVVAVNNSATGWGVYSSGTSPNYFAGKVGIGTATPYSALDVNTGAIRLGSGTQTCTVANDTGTIRYNSVTHKLQSCYLLSGWQDVGSGAIGAAAGADTQVQFNNNGNLGATSGLAFNSTSKVLTVGNRIIAGGSGADTNSVFVSGGNGTSTGADNAFFGVSSGVLNSSGANNVFLGYNAGSTNTTGANNILIGSGALAPAAGTNDWLNIGNVIKGDMSAGLLYISSTGALTLPIGDNSNKPAGTNGMIRYNTANGKFEAFQAGSWQDILTGAATANAAGLPTEVQLNEGGLLYASSGFTFNSASGQLTVTAGGAASTAGYFSNTQTSGFTFGVYGSVASDAGIAVSGRQTGVNNNSYAGYFINEGSGPLPNYGVSGTASSTGAGYGVVGREDGASNTGAGGYFENSGVGATANYGLFGLTISTGAGTGVYGWEDGANNIGYGVQAVNNSATGWGIYSSGTSPNYFRGRIGINAASPSVSLVVNGKDAIQIPAGLTGDRPAGVAGMIRFNSTTNVFEGYNGTIWGNLAGAGASISAAGLDKQVQFNNNGVLGATSGLAFNSTSGVLTVTDRAIIGGSGADTNSVFVSGGNGTSTGADNAFFGVSSGVLNSSGANNVFLGYNAGSTNTTGANNILIGSGALAAAAGTNNWLNIGNVIKGDMSSGLIYISSTGALTLPIGNNSNKPAGSNGMIRYNTANGKFEAFQAGAWQDILTGAATANAAGLPTQVQLNEGGLLYASSGFTFNSASGQLTVTAGGGASTAGYFGNTRVGGATYGVYGSAASLGAGAGVYGAETGANNTGYGVVAVNNSATGWGIYSSGTSPNFFAGSVGIGTGTPYSALDVNTGAIRLGSGTQTCTVANDTGTIRYNSVTHKLQSCYLLSGWTDVGAGAIGAAAGADKQVQFNNNGNLGAVAGLAFNSTSNVLTVANRIIAGGSGADTNSVFVSGGNSTSTGADNAFFGVSSGVLNSSGANNVFLGYNAGSTNTTGAGNILIGSGALAPAAGTNNWLNIGNIIKGDMSTGLLYISSTGALTLPIGDNSNKPAGSNGMIRYNTANGKFEAFQAGAWQDILTGAATANAAGLPTQVQLNEGGLLYASSGFTFNSASGQLTVTAGGGASTAGYFGNTRVGGATYGVYGSAASLGAGAGVYGAETGANNTGYGVVAVNNSATGWGIYSSGTSPNFFAGSVGIGTGTPYSALDVNTGAIRLGSGTQTCTVANDTGTIRYNSVTHKLQSCYLLSGWTDVGAGAIGAAAGADKQVQFNNNGNLGAVAGLAFNSTSNVLTVANRIIAGGSGADTNSVFVSGGNSTSTGADNAFFGVSSGVLNSSGANNVFLGYNAGSTNTTGAGNILIGSGALAPAAGTNNWLNIGNIIKGDMSTGLLYISSTGALTLPIGDNSNKPAGSNGMIRYNTANGKFEAFQAGAWQDILTGAATANAAGLPTQVQLNEGGLLYASSGFTFNSASGQLTVTAGGGASTAGYFGNTRVGGATYGVYGSAASLGAGAGVYGAETGANNTGYGVVAVNNSATGWGIYSSGTSPNFFAGSVGIGTGTPYSALDVNTGAIRLGSGTQTCTVANDTGTIRYNSVTHKLQSCYLLSGWTDVGAGAIGAAAGADKQVQFNNNGNLGAVAGLAFNSTSNVLTVANRIIAGGSGADTNSVFVSGGNSTSTGADNAFFGVSSGVLNSSGANNVFLGYNAGSTNTTGAGNILIGSGALAPAAGTNNWLNIGNIIKGDMSTGLLYISSTGALTLPIGDNSNKPAGSNGMIRYNTANGKFEAFQAGAWQDILTGAATANAAGLPTQVQLNEGGLLYASSGFTFNSASGQLTVTAGGGASTAGYFGNTRVGGATYGVYGSAASLGAGAGVYGAETGANNTGYGVVAVNNSATGWGIYSSGTSPNFFAGSVGIGTGTPYSALDVNTGAIRLGSGTQTCTVANDTGTIRYNSVTHKLQSCYLLSGWTDVGAGAIGAAAGADKQVQFNNNGNLGAVAGLAFNSTSNVLTVANRIIAGGSGADTNSVFVSGGNSTSTGADNAFFGVSSGVLNSSGANNVFLGYNAGSTNTTGAGNILIGSGALAPAAGTNNWLNIGNIIKGDMSTGLLYISSTGALTLPIGDNSNKPAGSNGMIRYNTANGKFEAFQAGAWQDILTGAATANAAGLPTQVQLNEGGLLYASSGFTFNSASGQLTVTAGGGASTAGYFGNTRVGGATYGVYGSAASLGAGAGVYGAETGANNTGYGVVAVNNSATGWGIYSSGTSPNFFAGSVGIGTGTPYSALDVNTGAIRLGSGTQTCTVANDTGTIRYNSVTHKLQSCYLLSGWTDVGAGAIGAAAGADQQVQINDRGVMYASSGLTFNSTSGVLTSRNRIIAGGSGKDTNSVFVSGGNGTSTGADNTALGAFALHSNTSGVFNTAVGTSALTANTTGQSNTAIGYNALIHDTSGASNTALGLAAIASNTTGGDNIAIGPSTLFSNTIGNLNTGLGYMALTRVTTGGENIGIGPNVGSTTLTTGSNNILIGTNAGVDTPAAGTNNYINIGTAFYGDMTGGVYYISGHGALTLPAGDNSNYPASPVNGMIRYNSAHGKFEAYQAGSWQDILTGSATANAAGLPTQVQLNEGGVLYASSGLTFNSSSGQLTVSKNLSVGGATADASHVIQTPVTGFSITVGDKVGTLTLTPAGTLASGTITMPAAPVNGQIIHIASAETITTLTLSPNAGQTIKSPIHTIASTSPAAYMYDAANTKWYRVQ